MRTAVAVKAIEPKASFGHTRSIEVCVGVARLQTGRNGIMAWISSVSPMATAVNRTTLTTTLVCAARRVPRSLTDAPSASHP